MHVGNRAESPVFSGRRCAARERPPESSEAHRLVGLTGVNPQATPAVPRAVAPLTACHNGGPRPILSRGELAAPSGIAYGPGVHPPHRADAQVREEGL